MAATTEFENSVSPMTIGVASGFACSSLLNSHLKRNSIRREATEDALYKNHSHDIVFPKNGRAKSFFVSYCKWGEIAQLLSAAILMKFPKRVKLLL